MLGIVLDAVKVVVVRRVFAILFFGQGDRLFTRYTAVRFGT